MSSVLARFRSALLPQTEPGDRRTVSLDVLGAQVRKQATTTADHLQKAAPRVMIVSICTEMVRKAVDPLCEKRDLDFRRTRIGLVQPIASNDLLFRNLFQRHAG